MPPSVCPQWPTDIPGQTAEERNEAARSYTTPRGTIMSELEVYLEIACVRDLVDVATSSEDAEQSKPAPDVFQVALKKLGLAGPDAVAIGDTPYDAEAAGKARIPTIGLLCGGFSEADLRKGGCVAVYPGPAALLACIGASPLAANLPHRSR
jgi:phosphoglycolate phosphatase-like HAD superfamily hydrolase